MVLDLLPSVKDEGEEEGERVKFRARADLGFSRESEQKSKQLRRSEETLQDV